MQVFRANKGEIYRGFGGGLILRFKPSSRLLPVSRLAVAVPHSTMHSAPLARVQLRTGMPCQSPRFNPRETGLGSCSPALASLP